MKARDEFRRTFVSHVEGDAVRRVQRTTGSQDSRPEDFSRGDPATKREGILEVRRGVDDRRKTVAREFTWTRGCPAATEHRPGNRDPSHGFTHGASDMTPSCKPCILAVSRRCVCATTCGAAYRRYPINSETTARW